MTQRLKNVPFLPAPWQGHSCKLPRIMQLYTNSNIHHQLSVLTVAVECVIICLIICHQLL